MTRNLEVDAWFAAGRYAQEATLRRVRDVVLDADSRVTEYIKYGTLAFGFEGDLATVVQARDRKRASLMFGRGARIKGDFPHLEGTGPTARFMRFENPAEVDALAAELRAIVVAWCELQDGTRQGG